MKLLFDENLASRLVAALSDLYPGSVHVGEIGMASAGDDDVWNHAAANGLTIVSKDSDFHQRSLVFGFPPKVVWIRRGNCSTNEMMELLRAHAEELLRFEADGEAAFLEID